MLYSTFNVLQVLSFTLASLEFTNNSSNVFRKPGTNFISFLTILSFSHTHISSFVSSISPMYVSGLNKTCSLGVFFSYCFAFDEINIIVV